MVVPRYYELSWRHGGGGSGGGSGLLNFVAITAVIVVVYYLPLLLYEILERQQDWCTTEVQFLHCRLHPGAWVPHFAEIVRTFLKFLEETYVVVPRYCGLGFSSSRQP